MECVHPCRRAVGPAAMPSIFGKMKGEGALDLGMRRFNAARVVSVSVRARAQGWWRPGGGNLMD